MVLFAHITSQVEGEPYSNLLMEKGFGGFPSLGILDAEGEIIARPAGRDVESFRLAVKDGAHYLDLAGKEKPTTDEQVELFGLDTGLGRLTYEEAKARADALEGLSEAQKRAVADALVPLEIQHHMPKGRSPGPEAMQAAGKHFLAMMKEGREPEADNLAGKFYSLILEHAYAEKDAESFGQALEKLRARFGKNPRVKPFFDRQDQRLEELRAAEKDG